MRFSLPYVAGWGGPFVLGLSGLGALLFFLGLLAFAIVRMGFPVPLSVAERLPVRLESYRDSDDVVPQKSGMRRALLGIALATGFGGALLAVTLGYLSAALWPSICVALFVAFGAAGMAAKREIDRRLADRVLSTPPPIPTDLPPVVPPPSPSA